MYITLKSWEFKIINLHVVLKLNLELFKVTEVVFGTLNYLVNKVLNNTVESWSKRNSAPVIVVYKIIISVCETEYCCIKPFWCSLSDVCIYNCALTVSLRKMEIN